jgi:hypothetical protein
MKKRGPESIEVLVKRTTHNCVIQLDRFLHCWKGFCLLRGCRSIGTPSLTAWSLLARFLSGGRLFLTAAFVGLIWHLRSSRGIRSSLITSLLRRRKKFGHDEFTYTNTIE